ncbi:MAG: hypothetical protein RSD40_06700, partial [Bacilli bacterium]
MEKRYFSNDEIISIFKCGNVGGMRRSYYSNSLVLFMDLENPTYPNFIDQERQVYHFSGMGKTGDQDLKFSQNKTLNNSNSNGIELHLFVRDSLSKDSSKNFKYEGIVKLVDEPYLYPHSKRNIYIFKLKRVEKSESIIDFLVKHKEIVLEDIISKSKHLNGNSIDKLIKLMRELKEPLDTLWGPNGWFLTKDYYFYNGFSKFIHVGNILELEHDSNKNFMRGHVFTNQNKYLNPYFNGDLFYEYNKLNSLKKPRNAQEGNDVCTQFRLISFKYSDEKFTFSKIRFINSIIENTENIFTTLIIGANGLGKSRCLAFIQKVFVDLYKAQTSMVKFKDDYTFELEYIMDGKLIRIIREGGNLDNFIDSVEVPLIKVKLPNKLLASAFTVNDKFDFKHLDVENFSRYEYLGVREKKHLVRVDTFMNNVALNILSTVENQEFLKNLRIITDFINMSSKIVIIMKVRIKEIFTHNLSLQELDNIVSKSTINKTKYYKMSDNDKMLIIQLAQNNSIIEFYHENDLEKINILIDMNRS